MEMETPQAASVATLPSLLPAIAAALADLPNNPRLSADYTTIVDQTRSEMRESQLPLLETLDYAARSVVETYPSFQAKTWDELTNVLKLLQEFGAYTASRDLQAVRIFCQKVLCILEPTQSRHGLVMDLMFKGPSDARDRAWNQLSPFCSEMLTLTCTVHNFKEQFGLLNQIPTVGARGRGTPHRRHRPPYRNSNFNPESH